MLLSVCIFKNDSKFEYYNSTIELKRNKKSLNEYLKL